MIWNWTPGRMRERENKSSAHGIMTAVMWQATNSTKITDNFLKMNRKKGLHSNYYATLDWMQDSFLIDSPFCTVEKQFNADKTTFVFDSNYECCVLFISKIIWLYRRFWNNNYHVICASLPCDQLTNKTKKPYFFLLLMIIEWKIASDFWILCLHVSFIKIV